jgi:NAD(P)-dependent dehydrogenase (short-subunit alcohol dehydrogenase family)/acyl carrier protein
MPISETVPAAAGADSKTARPLVEFQAVPPALATEIGTAKLEVKVISPVPSPALPGKSDAGDDPVKERILAVVAEKTGYPVDMLDLDLDLEADLGVDTVKQAEVFASVREAYGIVRDEQLKLRDFPTLAHVLRFVYDKRPDLVSAAPSAPAIVEQSFPTLAPGTDHARSEPIEENMPACTGAPEGASLPQQGASDSVKERILALVVEKTGYPREMLDLDLDLEADLGIDTVKQAEMMAAVRESYNIPRDENLKLRDFPTLARVIQFVYDKRPDLAGSAPSSPSAVPVAQIPAATQAADDDPIRENVLEIVAEKTGYPKDMLDLDLDLEADLGVDTVKQAEMFASVRAEYHIPRDETLKLRDFPTLAHVIKFARERQPGTASAPAKEKAASVPAPLPQGLIANAEIALPSRSDNVIPAPQLAKEDKHTAVPRPVLASLDAANSIPRRVPVPNLRPPLTFCKSTGVKLGPGQRVVVMADKGGIGQALAQRLHAMGLEVLPLQDAPDAKALGDRLKNWLSAGPVQGVYWLPALDNEGSLSDMDLTTWREALRVRIKLLYETMRVLYAQITPPGTFLVSATRLGGQHGYDEAGSIAPLGGAVVGFSKTYKRERIDALVKSVDFESAREPAEIAELLIAETLRDPGAVEIGYKDGQRWSVGLQEQPAADGQPGLTLDQDTVFLVTGAAGSIVSAITADLAAASGGTFYLLDLVPEPDENNPDLKRLISDKEGLKRDLFARLQARGERATPALVEKELAGLERAQAARSAIDAVRAAGGTAWYFSVDLTDADAVAKVIDQVRERSGRIDVLLHAAGTERSRFLPDKTAREFDLVFDVKSGGWFHLFHAIGNMPVRSTVAFSSIAGRFGNAGQADYSAANDLLCKIASNFRATRPATRAIAIDWTAWDGIGMAARGSIPKMMELAGIDMLPPEAGIPLIRRELTMGGTRGEIVIGQRLGILLNEWDSTGGLATTPLEARGGFEPAPGDSQEALLPDTMPPGPMIGKIASMGLHHGLTIETTLDPKIQPFLRDHQISDTPVLPGVMGIEAFAEAALSMLPGWHLEAIEEVNFLAPFKFYRNEPRTLRIRALIYPQGDNLTAECRLTGCRPLPNQAEPQVTTHFTARVRLSKQPRPVRLTAPPPDAPVGRTMEAADIYRVYFHGPAYQVLERAWRDGNRMIGLMARSLPSPHHPAERPTLVAPRLIELCFQTAGLWEMSEQGVMSLPRHVHEVCLWPAPELGGGGVSPEETNGQDGHAKTTEVRMYAVVTPNQDHGSFDAEVVDTTGRLYVGLSGYRTVALPDSVDVGPLMAMSAVA